MKQKYILLILLIIIIFTASLSVLAAIPNLELTPSTQSVGIGNQATVNILVEEVTDLRGASITLNFDASKLQYASSADGGFIPGAFLPTPTIDNINGSVTLDLASLSSYASGTGTIMIVVLERIATGDTNITFGGTTLRDKDNITIIHTKGIELKDPTATVSEWIFEKKLILIYLLTNKEAFTKLKNDLGLTEKQIEEIAIVVKEEAEKIFFLYKKSKAIATDTSLSLEERKKAIEDMKYNERIVKIIEESVQKVKEIFKDPERYIQFLEWIEEEWLKEHKKHME